jgi:hypothetical protein
LFAFDIHAVRLDELISGFFEVTEISVKVYKKDWKAAGKFLCCYRKWLVTVLLVRGTTIFPILSRCSSVLLKMPPKKRVSI